MTTPKTASPELSTSQAAKEATANEAFRRIEAGAGLFRVEDNDATAPPGSCADGAQYIPAATATGAWSGKEKYIAIAVGANAANGWYFIAPEEGMRAWIKDENAEQYYDGSAWATSPAGAGALLAANNLSDLANAGTARTNLGLGTSAPLDVDTDGTLAANSDAKIATQKAVKTAIAAAVTGLLDFKGATDCSANPNYPAASKGDAYVVSVAGKIGGGSGASVDVGDVYVASADNAGGTQASVGASWFILEHNLAGALLAANNLSDLANAGTARTNLGLGTVATLASDTDGSLAADSDSRVATQKAVKTYVDAQFAGAGTGDVVGPAGATAGHVAIFDGATGKLLKDGGVANLANGADITPAAAPSTTAVGYLGSPLNTGLDSGGVTTVMADAGKTFYHTDASARTLTIDSNANVAFPIGTVMGVEQGPTAGVLTIAITADTLQWGSSTGSRSVAANGGCSIQKMSATVWRLRGEGIS